MAAKRDYYEVLGVSRDADAKAIRAAYRRLAREHHPDVSTAPDAQQRFQEIGEAYAVLSDREKRARYDQFGHGVVEGVGFDFGGFPDIFEMFRAVVGGFGYEQEATLRGNDLLEEVEIGLEDVVSSTDLETAVSRYVACDACAGEGAEPGSSRERCPTCRGLGRVRYQQRSMFLSFSQEADCPDCDGTGVHIPKPCTKCAGSGRRRKTEKVAVRVPAGVEDGQRVRLQGAGDAGPLGSQSGDLYIQVRVRPHELFVRRGSDLVCEVPLDFAQLALGDKIEVPGITETHQVTIAAGTQHGQTISVRGGGLPRLRRPKDRGDLHILVRVDVPQRLSKKQRDLLLQLARASGLEISPQGQGLAQAIGEAIRGKG